MVRKPPSTGPNATAAPAAAPHAAKALARSRPWNVFDSNAKLAGVINAAPIPSITASPRMSVPTEWEIEAISEPTPNSVVPMMNMRRWP